MGVTLSYSHKKHEGFHDPGLCPVLCARLTSVPCSYPWSRSGVSPVSVQALPRRTEEHCPVQGLWSWSGLSLRLSQQAAWSQRCGCPFSLCCPRYWPHPSCCPCNPPPHRGCPHPPSPPRCCPRPSWLCCP